MRKKLLGILLFAISCALLFSACSGESSIMNDVDVVGIQSSDSESDDIIVYPVVISEEDEIPEAVDGILYFQKPDSSRAKNKSSSSRVRRSSSSVKSSSSSIILILDKESSSSISLVIQSSSSATPASSSANAFVNEWDWSIPKNEYLSPNIFYWKTLEDSRDGQVYYTVKIGDRRWMAQNLNYNGEEVEGESWCYDDIEQHCEVTGRLYTWKAAKVACPEGWRLPYSEEWQELLDSCGGTSAAGRILKSTIGWFKDGFGNDGNGTDSLGFSAIPAGLRSTDGEYGELGSSAKFWTSKGDTYADYLSMYYADRAAWSYHYVDMGFSVRCIEDLEN